MTYHPGANTSYPLNSPHKHLTVYTDSAPNSCPKLQTIPTMLNNLSSNFESITESILNFEVSETETCDSIQSDNFQLFPESPLYGTGYHLAKTPNLPSTYHVNLNHPDPSVLLSSSSSPNDMIPNDQISSEYVFGDALGENSNDPALDHTIPEFTLLYEIHPSNSYQTFTNESGEFVDLLHQSVTNLSDPLDIQGKVPDSLPTNVQVVSRPDEEFLSTFSRTQDRSIIAMPNDYEHQDRHHYHFQSHDSTQVRCDYNTNNHQLQHHQYNLESSGISVSDWIEPLANQDCSGGGGEIQIQEGFAVCPNPAQFDYDPSVPNSKPTNYQHEQHQQKQHQYINVNYAETSWNQCNEQQVIYSHYEPSYQVELEHELQQPLLQQQQQHEFIATNENGFIVSNVTFPVEYYPNPVECNEHTASYYQQHPNTSEMSIRHHPLDAQTAEFPGDHVVACYQNYWVPFGSAQVQQQQQQQPNEQQIQQQQQHQSQLDQRHILVRQKSPIPNAMSSSTCVQQVDMDLFDYEQVVNHQTSAEILSNTPCANMGQPLDQIPIPGNTISYTEPTVQHSAAMDPFCDFVPEFKQNLNTTTLPSTLVVATVATTTEVNVTSPKSHLGTCDAKTLSKLCCPHCSRSFIRAAHLEDHLRTHTGERPHWCILCGRQFTQASNLRRHLLSHKVWPGRPGSSAGPLMINGKLVVNSANKDPGISGDVSSSSLPKRKWYCRFCDQHFATYLQLRAHLVHHKDKQVYACMFDTCNSTFTNPNALLTHLVDRHRNLKQNDFECHVCHTKFPDFTHLIRHWLPRRSGTYPRCPSIPRKSNKKPANLAQKASTCISPIGEQPTSNPNSKTKIRLLPLERLGKLNHRFRFRCPFCRKLCLRLRHLRTHLAKCHANLVSTTKLKDAVTPTQDSNSAQIVVQPSDTYSTHSSSNPSVKTALFLLEIEEPESQSLKDANCTSSGHVLSSGSGRSLTNQRPSSGSKVGCFTCKLCGKMFQRLKPFEDHEIMCQRTLDERARRQRLRTHKQCKFKDIDPSETNTPTSGQSSPTSQTAPMNSTNDSTVQQHQPPSSSLASLPPRRSTRSTGFQQFWQPKPSRRKRQSLLTNQSNHETISFQQTLVQ